MNCDANVLATCKLAEYSTTCKPLPLLPVVKVQLSLGGCTVTQNLPATVFRQHGLRLLKTYMHQHFRWRNYTIESVHKAWYRKLIGPLLVECHTLWTLYNGECHGTEQKQKRTRQLQQLECHLHDLFKYKPTLLASDHDLLNTPVLDLITLPPGKIERKPRRYYTMVIDTGFSL